jgi:hypothetical protein
MTDAAFAQNFLNQYLHFGPSGMVKKLGRKFIVEWDGRGFDTVFSTKDEAMQRVRLWAQAVREWA